MRTISSGTLAFLSAGIAIDSCIIISVAWAADGKGGAVLYADRDLPDAGIPGLIVHTGGIDSSQNADSSGGSNALTVTLSDLDGTLKEILNHNDIHKRKVNVYQYFIGTDINDKILIFSGQITTPIIWDEGARTLSFDIVTKIEDNEIGFSAEMSNMPKIAPRLFGQSWPLVFGTVLHSPTLELQEIPTAFTTDPFSIVDRALLKELEKITEEIAAFPKVNYARFCQDPDIAPKDIGCDQLDENAKAFEEGKQLQSQLDSLTLKQRELQAKVAAQMHWVRARVNLIATTTVTSPFRGIFKVGNTLFRGELGTDPSNPQSGFLDTTTPVLEPGSLSLQDQLTKEGYQFYNAGTQVTIASNYELDYIVSIVPGTLIDVWAFQSFRGLKKLVKVPTAYYTSEVRDYGGGPGRGQTTTIIKLTQPLSTTAFLYDLGVENWENNFGKYLPAHLVATIDWDDTIYATFASSVGPNPVDIMIWLINTYTQNTYDTASFATARAFLTTLPMNFTIESQENVLSLLIELAYQCNCAIYLVEDKFHLKYLPALGTIVETLTEQDIDVGSLQVTTTPTEDLITKYIATWKPDYTPNYSKEVRAVFRFNIAKYGTHESTHNYFAYTLYECVEKVATFWMIRKSMTWKILKCKMFLQKLDIEVFDMVNLAFSHPYVADVTVPAMCIRANYNPTDHTIDAEFWTGVRLGEMNRFQFAWPAGLDKQVLWPLHLDIQSGAAGGASGGESQALPESNGFIWDIKLGDRAMWTNGDPNVGRDETSSPDPSGQGGAHLSPADIAGILGTQASSYQTPLPGPALIQNYGFPDRNQPAKLATEYCRSYPASIVKYVETKENGRQIYALNVYRSGIEGASQELGAYQLQIHGDDRIPEGTWCLLLENVYKEKDPSPGSTGFITERTIQVPVWLR